VQLKHTRHERTPLNRRKRRDVQRSKKSRIMLIIDDLDRTSERLLKDT
jgi:hypothetical protein